MATFPFRTFHLSRFPPTDSDSAALAAKPVLGITKLKYTPIPMAFRCAVGERVSCQNKGKLYEVITQLQK